MRHEQLPLLSSGLTAGSTCAGGNKIHHRQGTLLEQRQVSPALCGSVDCYDRLESGRVQSVVINLLGQQLSPIVTVLSKQLGVGGEQQAEMNPAVLHTAEVKPR